MTQRDTLRAIARRTMIEHGMEPDLPPAARAQLSSLVSQDAADARDLRHLLWSSIDNDESRDLDQLEVCGTRPDGHPSLLVAIADVDALVARATPIDDHARTNTTSVYTPAEIFPMLPPELSTDRTSLVEDNDRLAIVVDMAVAGNGDVADVDVYRAHVRNRAKLTYGAVGDWLGGGTLPDAVRSVEGLEAQLKEQDRLARCLRARRYERGALDFDRTELKPVLDGDTVRDLQEEVPNRARDLIEDLMIAANVAVAGFLSERGVPAIRRVVRTPQRWPRIVELAAQAGDRLPAEPDASALQQFLDRRRRADPDDFPELSIAVVKLLGRGEYIAEPPGTETRHFALAASHYTHATAPNRRFADLVTQRMVKSALNGHAAYAIEELGAVAARCTQQEDAANKVERAVRKSAAALLMQSRIGETFDGIVTGASEKGTWVRLRRPRVEGKVEQGFQGLDVGDRVRVRLVHTDAGKGFIDFVRA